MNDRFLTCIQCENSFLFSVEEQNRYLICGFDDPKRCPDCRKKRFKVFEKPERPRNQKGRKRRRSRRNGFDEYGEWYNRLADHRLWLKINQCAPRIGPHRKEFTSDFDFWQYFFADTLLHMLKYLPVDVIFSSDATYRIPMNLKLKWLMQSPNKGQRLSWTIRKVIPLWKKPLWGPAQSFGNLPRQWPRRAKVKCHVQP